MTTGPLSPIITAASNLIETIRPYRHAATPLDYNFGLLLTLLIALVLITPPTPGYKLLRAGVVAPVLLAGWFYCAWVVYVENSTEQWGTTILMVYYASKTAELLIFWVPEETVFRYRAVDIPSSGVAGDNARLRIPNGDEKLGHSGKHARSTFSTPTERQLLPEPVPPSFTLAKFYWALSLIWSYRGIGWNFTCPLPHSSRVHPFLRSSSRREYLKVRLWNFLLLWISWDAFRSFMNLSSASTYFGGGPIAPPYSSLTTWQRAVYSICVSARIVIDIQKSHTAMSLICVALGGVMGWESESWSPWGWPPLFGSFAEVWKYPGLATMWSRTWQHYFRRVLHIFGWIGISENILGLTHSGQSAHPRSLATTGNSTPTASQPTTPSISGRSSPSNPIPAAQLGPTSTGTGTHQRQRERQQLTFKLATSNFLKSLIVFALSGLLHDCGTLSLRLLHTPPSEPVKLDNLLALTPFFLLQPFALVTEAVIKSVYRRWKRQRSEWNGVTPDWLVLVERSVGFAWTWIWLGWSAQFFVDGLTKEGKFSRAEGRPLYPSLLGGLLWGRYMH